MDTLDINDAHYDRKILDLQRRYDEQYDTIEEIEVQIGELQGQNPQHSAGEKSPVTISIGSYWHLMKSTIPQQKRNRKSL